MAKVRNTLGATPEDPCGPFSNEANILSGCTGEYVASWIETGDLIATDLRKVASTQFIIAWLERWSVLKSKLRGKGFLNPMGMNWGGGAAVMWSDGDARLAAAAVVDGAQLLEGAGVVLPPSISQEGFKLATTGDQFGVGDWLGVGLAVGLLGLAAYGAVYYYGAKK